MNNRSFAAHYHFMLFPGLVLLSLFQILPMFGIVIAFQRYLPAKGVFGSEWVGFDNLLFMFQIPDSRQVFVNTLIIATAKIIAGLVVPVIFALLLNEIRKAWFKRTVQTIVYVPHFLSWVVLAIPIMNIFAYNGIVNQLTAVFGAEPVMFMASNTWFRPILVSTDVWKSFGFGTIVYLAAIAGINPNLYESAEIDGARRIQKMVHITLPGMASTIILLATLSLGDILNAGFEQVFNLYNPMVYETGDIIDTYVYRVGLVQLQFSLGTAVGLLKSVVSFVLIIISYKLASTYANYRIF